VCRSVASNVSALSSGVANGHQTMQHVSSSPSKIPYGGFSPVRLQTRSPRRPSSSLARSDLYAVLVRPSDPVAIAGNPTGRLSPHLPSRGPWLASGLCCPAESSLTMASSETLVSSCRLMLYTAGLCGPTTSHRRPEVPQFTLHVCPRVPHSVPRWTARLLLTVTSSHILAFAIFALARRPLSHKIRFIVVCVTRLQVSLYATARWVCLPRHGQDFYFRAFTLEDRSPKMSSITTWAYSQFP